MFYKRAKSPDGLALKCISCDKQYKQANKEKIAARRKNYNQKNKERFSLYAKEYREKNLEEVKDREKSYKRKNKDKIAEVAKQYRVKNPEKVAQTQKKYLESNREKVLERQKKYREKNKPLRTSLERKRQASKMKRTPAWLTEFDKIKMKCLYQLAAMRTRESGQEWHVDHIIPLQGKLVCGLHVPSNLRVITAFENMQKHNNFSGVEA